MFVCNQLGILFPLLSFLVDSNTFTKCIRVAYIVGCVILYGFGMQGVSNIVLEYVWA